MKLLALLKTPERTPSPGGEGSPFERAQKLVARVLAVTPAEAAMRLNAEAPAVLAMLPDTEVDAHVEALRAERLPASSCPVPVPREGRLVARTLTFEKDGAVFADRQGTTVRLAFPEIVAILRGQQLLRVQAQTTEKVKEFSMSRAVLTQGLSMTKTSEKTVRSQQDEVTHFVRVYGRSGECVSIEDAQMAFACLGPDLQPTKLGNIQLIAQRLRERAPRAFFDDRLLRLGRRPLPFTLAAPNTLREGKIEVSRTETSSSVDVISYLLVSGLQEGLLP